MPSAPPLIGTYPPPGVRRGDRVFCVYRDCECVVTTWTDAPNPWPRVRPLWSAGGGVGLWVDDTLARAIRTEASIVLAYWWGVSRSGVYGWRRWAGVNGHCTTPGSTAAQRAASGRGAATTAGVPLPAAECKRRVKRSKELNLIRFAHAIRWAGMGWTAEMELRLGTTPDADLATEWEKSVEAVRQRRTLRGIARFTPPGLPDLPVREAPRA